VKKRLEPGMIQAVYSVNELQLRCFQYKKDEGELLNRKIEVSH